MKIKIEKIAYGFLVFICAFVQIVCRTLETSGNMIWNMKNIFAAFGISILCVIMFFFAAFVIDTIWYCF